MDSSFFERRFYPRVKHNAKIKIKTHNGAMDAEIHDVSVGGISIISKDVIEIFTHLELFIPIFKNKISLFATSIRNDDNYWKKTRLFKTAFLVLDIEHQAKSDLDKFIKSQIPDE